MPRKDDAHMDELEGVAQRLRDERPQASPLDLDRIKTTAMSRAKSAGKGRAGARRLAVAGLTVGLLVATTGGVLAGENHGKNKGGGNGGGNAANAQYGGECNIQNGSGNVGDNNGQGAENNACNENTFIENNSSNNTTTNNITNTYNSSTVTVAAPANSGVQGTTTTKKATTSSKHVKIHINVPNRSRLRKVTLRVNGKIVSVLRGKRASKNVTLVSLPCSATVTITAVTASGKTVTQTHKYNLC
jgi:hypothetical protein